MARQAALLLLTVHGYEIPIQAVDNDFYRQALELDLRGKREYTEALLNAMGGISRVHFSRYKALLKLSDDAMELSDRYNIDEGKLRHVLSFPEEDHIEVIKHIVELGLTSRQVKQLSDSEQESDVDASERNAQRIIKLFKLATTTNPNDLVTSLVKQEGDYHLAKARLNHWRDLLNKVEILLDEKS